MNLKNRLTKLETRLKPTTTEAVIHCDDEVLNMNEPDFQQWLAAHHPHAGGHILLVPNPLPPAEWDALAQEYGRNQ